MRGVFSLLTVSLVLLAGAAWAQSSSTQNTANTSAATVVAPASTGATTQAVSDTAVKALQPPAPEKKAEPTTAAKDEKK